MFKNKKQKRLFPILALVVANSLWGLNTIFTKISVETIPPAINVGARFTIAALFVLPFAVRSWKPMKSKHLLLFVLASVFGITLSSLLFNIGIRQVPAFNSAVIWLTSPIPLLVLSIAMLKEKMSVKTFVGIMVAIVGSIIVIGRPDSGASNLAGSLLILLSVFFDVISILISKSLIKKVSSYQAGFLNLFPGALIVLIYALAQRPALQISTISRASALAFIASTITLTIANVLFYYALRYRQAHTVGCYSYLDPLFTVIGAWFILGERPAPVFIIGAGLIVAGLYFTEMHKKHRRHLHARHHLFAR